jgi:hypothetical protein
MAISVVMPGPVPGIHVFRLCRKIKTWMAPEVGLADFRAI